MSEHYGPRTCGTVRQFGVTADERATIARGGDTCFAHQDCTHPLPEEPKTVDCPDLPVVSVERLVRMAREQPQEQEVIVTGRLTLANDAMPPGFAPYPPLVVGE
jgi:hypothetical protein